MLTNSNILEPLRALCRVCFKPGECEKFVNIFDNSVRDKIHLVTQIFIDEDEYFAPLICNECSEQLNTACKFKEKCEKSEIIWKQFNTATTTKNSSPSRIFFKLIPAKKNVSDKQSYCSNGNEKTGKVEKNNNVDSIESNEIIPFSVVVTNGKEAFVCSRCDKRLGSKSALSKHVIRMHNMKKRNYLVSGHGSERRYKCSHCSYSSSYSQTTLNHMRVHTGEKPYKCEQCSKQFSQLTSYRYHKKYHSSEYNYTCLVCGKQFKYRTSHDRHKLVHSKDSLYSCSVCGKCLKSRDTYNAHMNRHNSIKNFSCDRCGSTFVTKLELSIHIKRHNQDKTYSCNLCDFKAITKNELNDHIRRHSGGGTIKCDSC